MSELIICTVILDRARGAGPAFRHIKRQVLHWAIYEAQGGPGELRDILQLHPVTIRRHLHEWRLCGAMEAAAAGQRRPPMPYSGPTFPIEIDAFIGVGPHYREVKRQMLCHVLVETKGNVLQAARQLKIEGLERIISTLGLRLLLAQIREDNQVALAKQRIAQKLIMQGG